MLFDALLAWVHFLCIFALVSTLISELVLYRREMDAARVTLLRSLDRLFGIAAGLVIVSGVLRVTLGLKGAVFYLHNPFFWTKMGLFLAVGLLSIPPTIHYLRLASDGTVIVPEAAYRRTWVFLGLEVALLAFSPLMATLLAHGYD
jgi:putative membrane protein